jgi:prepilin-type N-terminal cleavage/methylation domain-containing protein
MIRPSIRQAGFTLVEVVLAVIILAAAAAILLPRARGLLDYAERARRHYAAAGRLLDRVALLPALDLNTAEVKRDHDVFTITPKDSPAALPIKVSNLPVEGSDVPISEAPSPFQYFAFEGDLGHRVTLVGVGLIGGTK